MQIKLMFDSYRRPTAPVEVTAPSAPLTRDAASTFARSAQMVRRSFAEPLIADIAFPKLDAQGKDAAQMTIKLEPEPTTPLPAKTKLYQHNQTDLEFLLRSPQKA